MGQDPTHQGKSGAFSMASVGDTTQATTSPASSVHEPRHVLPKDLTNAVKHLNDSDLDRLLAVTLAEAKRRGRQTTPTHERSQSQNADAPVSLTRGQLNAVRAAFKAGITPARIARQFGLSQSDVRTALQSDEGK
jgi:predicted DNA binding protein